MIADYPDAMQSFFVILMLISMILVLASFGLGMVSMVKGGEFAKKHGGKFMQWRVFLQALALACFALALLFSSK